MLSIPQLRVLAVLEPGSALGRQDLQDRIGYSRKGGTITRVMNGIPEKSSSGKPTPGLVDLGYVTAQKLEIEKGLVETVYTITESGRQALKNDARATSLPDLKDKEQCTNHRYT